MYDEMEYFIGESMIFHFSVFAKENKALPVIQLIENVIYQNSKYYLIGFCSQKESYPLGEIKFRTNINKI